MTLGFFCRMSGAEADAEVLGSLLMLPSWLQDVPILCGDVGDQASVDAVVKGSRVVLSTTGPYALMGTPVVDACVRMRTHYCDLTGELHVCTACIKVMKMMHPTVHGKAWGAPRGGGGSQSFKAPV